MGLRAYSAGGRAVWAWQAGFPIFPARHAVFARLGGESLPPYGTLNLGLHVGDDPARVVRNRKVALGAIGLSLDSAVAAEQVHGDRVAVVGAPDAGKGAFDYATAVAGADALITRARGIALFGYFADCLPVFACDDAGEWAGLAHAGWKGTVRGVTANMVRALAANGVSAARLRIALGPCIGPCCYEVGDDVAAAFRERFGPDVVRRARSGRVSVDLVLANRRAAMDAGVAPDRIVESGLCTSCRTDLFFSHRAEGPKTGRMAGVIAW